MFTVSINVAPLVTPDLSAEAVQTILADIAESARNHWIGLAGKAFTQKADYINGIQPVEMKPGLAVITLVGAVANILENGSPALDMRTTLLGPNVPVVPMGQRGKHQSKAGGYYRAIPFRHSTPTSGGTIAPPMGSAYKGAVPDAKALGKQVYGKARKLSATTSAPGQGTKWGGRLPAGLAPKLKPHHKTDIYAGMVRKEKTYKAATQSSYATFRTISTRVKIGWIRPPVPGKNLAQDVQLFVQTLAPKAFEAYAAAAMGGPP